MSEPLTIKQRVAAPTPPFFKKLRAAGALLVAVSAALLAGPLPAILTKVAGYLAVAGSVATAISQTAVDETSLKELLNNEQ